MLIMALFRDTVVAADFLHNTDYEMASGLLSAAVSYEVRTASPLRKWVADLALGAGHKFVRARSYIGGRACHAKTLLVLVPERREADGVLQLSGHAAASKLCAHRRADQAKRLFQKWDYGTRRPKSGDACHATGMALIFEAKGVSQTQELMIGQPKPRDGWNILTLHPSSLEDGEQAYWVIARLMTLGSDALQLSGHDLAVKGWDLVAA
ncbi:hypothetical protein H0H93_008100 [Arthromyces matolae]|nr:hypothetical protein H0H93_008100 [Arthromyces matolae]